MRNILNLQSILFVLLVASIFVPGGEAASVPYRLLILVAIIEAAALLRYAVASDSNGVSGRAWRDVSAVLFVVLLTWHLLTERFGVLDAMLFPTPEAVLKLFIFEIPDLFKGLGSSLILLVTGYFLALVTAIPLGLLVGWRRRLFYAVNPFTKVLGPIPPIVYIPYAIALLPTFRMASIFVIFVGAFWPLFINTVNGVSGIEKTLIDSARVLNLKERTMLFRIILPGALPSIVTGATLALVFSFILLTAAELIGATSGIGWYVKNFSDFADYPRVVIGIIFIGFVVTAVTFFTERIERRLLRWRS